MFEIHIYKGELKTDPSMKSFIKLQELTKDIVAYKQLLTELHPRKSKNTPLLPLRLLHFSNFLFESIVA